MTRLRAQPLLWLVPAAVLLRLVIFLGRGDYVAFDEGWYLLLGRNLLRGDGFSLSGLQHVTLSPLFPLFSAAVDLAIDNPVWSGRLVAAFAGGLLVWPCWSIFLRLAGRSTALLACVFVACVPTLAPFAAAYWIGWDLWVGAEPLLHLFLYGAIALALRALERERTVDWVFAGMSLGLAYLARPEAILPAALLGGLVGAAALWRRNSRQLVHALVLAAAFAATALPYWLYLRESLGRWALSGRGVELASPLRAMQARAVAADAPPTGSQVIESMLWQNDQRTYVERLYGLDATATRLASTYWGVPREVAAPATPPDTGGAAVAADPTAPAAELVHTAPVAGAEHGTRRAGDAAVKAEAPRAGRWAVYRRALGIAVPWFLWPLLLIGLLGPRRSWRSELLFVLPIAVTSVAVARVVAADPRTQLFIVPVVVFYAARAVRTLAVVAHRRLQPQSVRPGYLANVLTAAVVLLFLITEAQWVYNGVTLGSPHHVVGAANRRVGEVLGAQLPAGEPVMSWHPALALYARRDWRVLPHAPFGDVVRYANATGTQYAVLSVYYPSPLALDSLPGEYLLLRIPAGAAAAAGHFVEVSDQPGAYLTGRLRSR